MEALQAQLADALRDAAAARGCVAKGGACGQQIAALASLVTSVDGLPAALTVSQPASQPQVLGVFSARGQLLWFQGTGEDSACRPNTLR